MEKYQTFEDLRIWQDARALTDLVYGKTNSGEIARDFNLRDQLRRTCISMMGNIARGKEQGGRQNLKDGLTISKGSVGSFLSHLCVAEDAGYFDEATLEELREKTEAIRRGLGGFIHYLWKAEKEQGELPGNIPADAVVNEEAALYGCAAAS